MKKILGIIIFLPLTIYSQNWEEILYGQPEKNFFPSKYENHFSMEVVGGINHDTLHVKQQESTTDVSITCNNEIILSLYGDLIEYREDSSFIYFKVLLPACCCLRYSTTNYVGYNKLNGNYTITEFQTDSTLLIPPRSFLCNFSEESVLNSSVSIYSRPELTNKQIVDPCSGELDIQFHIGNFLSSKEIVLFQDQSWKFVIIETKGPETNYNVLIFGWTPVKNP